MHVCDTVALAGSVGTGSLLRDGKTREAVTQAIVSRLDGSRQLLVHREASEAQSGAVATIFAASSQQQPTRFCLLHDVTSVDPNLSGPKPQKISANRTKLTERRKACVITLMPLKVFRSTHFERVDLTKLVSYVRTCVRPSVHKKFLRFQ